MHQIFTDYILEINKIYDKNCNAVILQRNFPSLFNIQNDISRLDDNFWLRNQCIYFTTSSANEIHKAMNHSLQYNMLQRTLAELVVDVTDIFAHFKDVFKVEKVNFRMEKIVTNSCKLFHTDSVNARAFITYYGLGTEFVNEANINPMGKTLWDGKISHEEKNKQLLVDPRKIIKIFPGDIIFMKGNKWADKPNAFSPLYHKSPEINDLNPFRFIVSFDF